MVDGMMTCCSRHACWCCPQPPIHWHARPGAMLPNYRVTAALDACSAGKGILDKAASAPQTADSDALLANSRMLFAEITGMTPDLGDAESLVTYTDPDTGGGSAISKGDFGRLDPARTGFSAELTCAHADWRLALLSRVLLRESDVMLLRTAETRAVMARQYDAAGDVIADEVRRFCNEHAARGRVVAPMFKGMHCSFFVYNLGKSLCVVIDSLAERRGMAEEAARELAQKLLPSGIAWSFAFNDDERARTVTLLEDGERAPIQGNGHDCVLYTLAGIQCVLSGKKVSYTEMEVTAFRELMPLELFVGQPLWEPVSAWEGALAGIVAPANLCALPQ